MGPVIIAENVGAIRSADPGDESGACGHTVGPASAWDDAATSRACSNVASGTAPAALLEAINDAIAALDAGKADGARARLHALAETVRATCHAAYEHGV